MSVLDGRRTRALTVLVTTSVAFAGVVGPATADDDTAHVVVLSTPAVADAAANHGVAPDAVFTETLTAYVADLDETQAAAIARDPDVAAVVPDVQFELTAEARATRVEGASPQEPSTGLRRIGGLRSPTADIDGVDDRVDVDIVVIDSGVDAEHPDLHVARSIDCAGAETTGPFDDHGTHVAGIIAAVDDDIGVVGVAPGARITSIRVADAAGLISLSSLLCATEWVAANAATVDVVNLSLAGPRLAARNTTCGRVGGDLTDPLHASICAGVQRGVTYVVAAGNQSIDARELIPAGYPEVITVSAYTDFDGRRGGRADPVCFEVPLPEEDDTMAFFSNHGPAVDIAAPGVCIESTVAGGGYGILDGTSMSAPHVAGAAGLVLQERPWLSPAGVKARLLRHGERGPLPQDPDGYPEPLLSVRRL
jgi:subtilisin